MFYKPSRLKTPTEASVTIIPAMHMPAAIEINDFFISRPKRKANKHAVHAPVIGKGIETKNTSPK